MARGKKKGVTPYVQYLNNRAKLKEKGYKLRKALTEKEYEDRVLEFKDVRKTSNFARDIANNDKLFSGSSKRITVKIQQRKSQEILDEERVDNNLKKYLFERDRGDFRKFVGLEEYQDENGETKTRFAEGVNKAEFSRRVELWEEIGATYFGAIY